jgi:putative spermidine/putrescine transport system permease protein
VSGVGLGLKAAAAFAYAFLLSPVLVVIAIAFSADSFIAFPPSGVSFRWFERLVAHAALMEALNLSLMIATTVTVISLLVGVPAARALAGGRFHGRDALKMFFLAPLLLPTLVMGLALLLTFQPWRLTATVPGLVLAHLLVTVPFVIRMMTTAFLSLPSDIEAAAATLGAKPWRVSFRVTLPLAAPGLIASGCLSFLLSFDETVISLFISGPRASTLPVEMVRYVEGRTDPLIAALSVVLVAATMAVVFLVERLVGFTRAMGR